MTNNPQAVRLSDISGFDHKFDRGFRIWRALRESQMIPLHES